MLKPLTLSVGLAVALCAGGVSLAGHKGCLTCGLASPQASPQGVTATAQSYGCETAGPCKKKHNFFGGMGKLFKHEKTYTYEWVLKKKRVWGHKGGCSICGGAVTPSGQYASPQGSPQAASIYGAAQTASTAVPSVGEIAPANLPDEPPAPPATAEPAGEKATSTPGASAGLLFSNPTGE